MRAPALHRLASPCPACARPLVSLSSPSPFHHPNTAERNDHPNSVRYLDAEQTEAVIDWEDPQAARALTTTLLQHDFGLAWDVPPERLCPPVPNRLNYVCWIRDLLLLGGPQLDDAAGG